MEKEMLGLYISDHPLHRWQPVLAQRTTAQLGQLVELPDHKEVVVGGLVSGMKRAMTRSGSAMAFITLEDLTGSVEVVVFPRIYEQQAYTLKRDAVLLLRGKVDIEDQTAKLLCEEILPLPAAPDAAGVPDAPLDGGSASAPSLDERAGQNGAASARPALRVRVSTREEIEQLEQYLLDHPGDRQLYVHVVTGRGDEHVVPARRRLRDGEGMHQELEQLFGEGNVWEE